MDAFEAIKATFFQECDELLAELESKLMLLEQGQTDLETINAVFRAVHSVKGGAGAFGLEALVRFAHVFETLMDELRGGRKPCDAVTIKTLLRASDVLADHIQAAQGLAPPVDEERSAGLVQELELLTHGGEAPPAVEEEEEDDFGFTPMAFDAPLDDPALAVEAPAADAAPAGQPGWRIVFKPHGRMYGSANEAGLLLREVGRLGPITVSVDEAALPTLDVLVAEDGYLTWTIDLVADVDEKAVREVFDFVEADCDLTITPLGGAPALVFEEEPPAVLPASDELDIAALLAKAAAGAAPETPAAAPAPAPAPQSVAPQSVTPEPAAPAPVAAQVSAPEPAPAPA
uniref:Hpt domain-containing protein n=1 Tax=Brevundimonas aurantiaca TaxID=74316 RepID=UPI00174AD6D8